MNRIKEAVVLLLIIVFAVAMSISPRYKDIPTETLARTLSADTGLEQMEHFSNSRFKKDYSMNANEFVSVEYYGYEDIMDSETFLLVKSNDQEQLRQLETAISERRKYLMEVFRSYAPENYELLENAVLEIRGDYLVYLVMDNSEQVFQSLLKEIRE